MIPDIRQLYEALQYGSAGQAGGSLLFDRIRGGRDAKAIEKNPLLKDALEYLEKKRGEFRGGEIPGLPYRLYALFDTTGDRREFEGPYFERRNRLLVYGLSAWLWGKPEDIRDLEDIIWAICGEYSWCLPAHMSGQSLVPPKEAEKCRGILAGEGIDNGIRLDIFACETGFALAECCAMLETVLSPLVLVRARNEVYRRLIKSYLDHGALQHWELLRMNWCAVCGGSLGGAACYLIEDDRLLGGILYKLLPTLDRFLDSFTADGACIEGLSYWTYGVSFWVSFADLLFHRTGGKIDLLRDRRFEKIARFQQSCYLPGGGIINFSDARDTGFSPGLASFLKARIPGVEIPPLSRIMALNQDGASHFAPALRDLLWADPEIPSPPGAEQTAVFPDAQWLICAKGDTAFAAKGGHNDEPHNHNDVGTFIYYKKGKMVFADLGSGEYVKDYFNENRYTIFCNQSFSHSVPLVAGQGQKPGREFGARDCSIGPGGGMTLDIAPAYGIPGLSSLKRRFLFDPASGRGTLTLEDRFVFSGEPLPVTERFISLYLPEVKDGLVRIDTGDSLSVLRGQPVTAPAIHEQEHRNPGGKAVRVFLIDFSFLPGDIEFSANFEIS
ncbi:MAG: heparinase II/III-family protein [Treponema sp.]|jgi:hypothetical protein|nr:heparinase II/III-family protein [Treponema sp.]